MPTHTKVIVVGGGGMGLAAAWRLAKGGTEVRILEQFDFFHKRGSSHTEHRIIRRTYNHALYTRLMPAAYRLWEELETDSGQKLMYLNGGVEFGAEDDPLLQNVIHTGREFDVPLDVMTPAEAHRRFPQFHLPANHLMVYCAQNGFLAVDDCLRAQAAEATKHGAILQDQEPVLEIRPLPNGAEVRTTKDVYTCDRLILTAGPYVKNLMQQLDLAVPYTIEVNQVQWFKTDKPELFSPDRFPIFIFRQGEDGIDDMYGFPTFQRAGVKVGLHHSRHYINVEDYDMQPHEDVTRRVWDFMRAFIPDASLDVIDVGTCLYDFPPDGHFVISLHPHHPDIAMANMAGHGYKFAVLVGEILAQLALEGRSTYDLTGLSVERFLSPSRVPQANA
ncbi:MAG: N-methyl-L-tryptophan oxidase [Anaerolineae bacterium]|nr:N-methyl-L-tryptophan oxidase [Anaerolineae bacterium]